MDQIRERFTEIEETHHASYLDRKLIDDLILVMGCAISGITELADVLWGALARRLRAATGKERP